MYHIEAKFETILHEKLISKDFEMVFGASIGVPFRELTVSTTMTLDNVAEIPTEDMMNSFAQTIFQEYSKGFADDPKMNVDVVKTQFVGFTKITKVELTDIS